MDIIVLIAAIVIGWIGLKVLEDDYLFGSVKTHPIIKQLSLVEMAFAMIATALVAVVAAAMGSNMLTLAGLAFGAAWIVLAFVMYLGSGAALRTFRVLNVLRFAIPLLGWWFSCDALTLLKKLEQETQNKPADSLGRADEDIAG